MRPVLKLLKQRVLQVRPQLPNFPGRAAKPGDPPVFSFNEQRASVMEAVTRRIVSRYKSRDPQELLYLLSDAANTEVRRLASQKDAEAELEISAWRKLLRSVGRMRHEERVNALERICAQMSGDVAGNFDPRVYNIALRIVPGMLSGVMSPGTFPRQLLQPGWPQLDSLIKVEGPIERLRKLAKIGTFILVPTHSSNLDSVALGYALARERLPPVVYGAGKNLFTNPIISFFMHNLGAYRVDRRVKARLYKEVLKGYSTEIIRRGYHSLFFPGGTRSRSNMIEKHLKLGLAGTAVSAFAESQLEGNTRPVFFVPVTINYPLVLEAETLIDDYLKGAGQSRYIITDDEFSQVDRMLAFLKKVLVMRSGAVLRFAEPLDPFCNPVDELGRSLSPSGRPIDPGTYVQRGGAPVLDEVRDKGYTRELGEVLPNIYRRETVVLWTHLVAHVLYRFLVLRTPDRDLFTRQRVRYEAMRRDRLIREVGLAQSKLIELELDDQVRLGASIRSEPPARLVDEALDAWSGYHTRPIVKEEGDAVRILDPNLLLFYQNRVVDFAEALATPETAAAARTIAAMGEGR